MILDILSSKCIPADFSSCPWSTVNTGQHEGHFKNVEDQTGKRILQCQLLFAGVQVVFDMLFCCGI